MQTHRHPYVPKAYNYADGKANKVTKTPGEFNGNVPSYEPQLTFVTMEDVLGYPIDKNYVCYNPNLSKEKNEHILKSAHENTFKHKKITDEDLDALTVYDKFHLLDFVKAYKAFLNIE